MKKVQVVGIGSVLVDHYAPLPSFPKEDTKNKMNSFFDEIGGPVPVALMFLAHLGRRVKFVGSTGDDNNGRFIERYLNEKGVDIAHVKMQRGKNSGSAQVWINEETGSRTVVYNSGTLDPLPEKYVTEDMLEGVVLLHIDGREPETAIYAADMAREMGIMIAYDTGNLKPQSENLLKRSDIIISPLKFSIDLFGEHDLKKAAERLKNYGPDIVIVTNGENGLAYSSFDGTFLMKSYPVKAVDTNGAGDIFCGAFIHALLSKKKVQESVSFASAAAALKCTRLGKENLPTEKEIINFLKE